MNDIQKHMLTLLKEFDAICTTHGIEYYIAGGTLLGAVRHGGFLPWDDDVDIDMTRENWNKFQSVVESSPLPGRKITDTTIYRYVDTTTTRFQRYHLDHPLPDGVSLDLFVLDPLPDSLEAQTAYFDLSALYVALLLDSDISLLRCHNPVPFWRYYCLGKLIGRTWLLNHIKQKVQKLRLPKSQYYGSSSLNMYHQPFPEAFYGKPQRVQFEDTQLLMPARPYDWLELRYDDRWMNIPIKAFQIDHDAPVDFVFGNSIIFNDFSKVCNEKAVFALSRKRRLRAVNLVSLKRRTTACELSLVATKTILKYREKLKGVNLSDLVSNKKYTALADLFGEFFAIQGHRVFVGNPAHGWQGGYMRAFPELIDLGDEALTAALAYLVNQGSLTLFGKIYKARERTGRPMPKELLTLRELYAGIQAAKSAFYMGEHETLERLLKQFYPPHMDNLHLARLCMQHCLKTAQEDLLPQGILPATEEALVLYPDDPELLLVKAKIFISRSRLEEAAQILTALSLGTRHALVLHEIRDLAIQVFSGTSEHPSLPTVLHCVEHVLGGGGIEDLELKSDDETEETEDVGNAEPSEE